MSRKVIILLYSIGLYSLVASCGQGSNVRNAQQNITDMPAAKQIKINALPELLNKFGNGDLDADFFGITSNGTDCIYFVQEGNLYAIEFEVMTEEQKPWIDKLKTFAQQHHYKTWMTTYGNQPAYHSSAPAPVLRILTESNAAQTAAIGQNVMMEVFGNNEQTLYDIVP